jgi:transcriptional regulator with GAF, ATPase, and Fis domain
VTPGWTTELERAWRCLERWEIPAAREAAEKARSLAAGWGDVGGVARADVLLARVMLLASSEQAVRPSNLPVPGGCDAALAAALGRLDAERAAVGAPASTVPEIPALQADSPVDAIAAAAIVGTLRSSDPRRKLHRIAGAAAVGQRPDALGWQDLVEALESEAVGGTGMPAVERALLTGEREQGRALLWTGLALRAALCERRGAGNEVSATRERMRRLVESWAITLPVSEAVAALSRPDRARLRAAEAPNPSVASASTRLVEVALALGQERDVERLIELALDAALAVTGAERGILLLLDPPAGYKVAAQRHVRANAEAGQLLDLSSTVARLALESDEVVVANEVGSDPRLSDRVSVAVDVTSLLCAPIHARGERQGAIYLDRRASGRPFDEASVSAARAIGSMLASALLGARMIADLEARSRELEAARDELSVALARRTVERDDISRRLANLRDIVPAGGEAFVGRAPAMLRLGRMIASVGASDAPVLISGETGSGKELVARAIHAASPRRDRPFVAINCGALSETLLAAELFGAERGAYTGATASRPGLFVAADGGTLLLDEVGDMPPAMQTSLLRVLETSEIRPVGATRPRKVDVRVLAASHRDLLELVRRGSFRDDLRYRLEVVRIEVPPLRDRIEDLPELSHHLLEDVRRRYNLPERRLSPAALQALGKRRWPGNVRELRHVLAGASLAAAGAAIQPDDLPAERSAQETASGAAAAEAVDGDGHAVRIGSIRSALRATAGHRGRAAKMLGISRSTLYRYLQSGEGGGEAEGGAEE